MGAYPASHGRRLTKAGPRVLMIGLDAAEPSLIEEWMEDGTLPALRCLRDRGAYGRLASTAAWLSGSTWPTFYSGTSPGTHGLYHRVAWQPDAMTTVRPAPDRLPLVHFWRQLGALGLRVVVIDVPHAYPPTALNGVEISGWGTSEAMGTAGGYPARTWRWVRTTFGPPPHRRETYGLMPLARLLRTRDEERRVAERLMAIALALMEREEWDLFLVCFEATHRGGHKLWDETGALEPPNENVRRQLRDALRDVYAAADTALGRLVEAAGEETAVLIFSVHGMGANTSRTEVLGPMLDSVLAADGGAPVKRQLLRGLDRRRQTAPFRWAVSVTPWLPFAWQDRLAAFWKFGSLDWDRTRAFRLAGDLQGYIRINLRGREARGIVEPGPECNDLCERIAEGLRTFVDSDTGEPVIRAVARSRELFHGGERLDYLPDLIVDWSPLPAASHREIVSTWHGRIAWPTPGKHPSGRSGNHRGEGFVIAAGADFPPGGRFVGAHVLDLAPTLFSLFGLPPPAEMRGGFLTRRCGRPIFPPP